MGVFGWEFEMSAEETSCKSSGPRVLASLSTLFFFIPVGPAPSLVIVRTSVEFAII